MIVEAFIAVGRDVAGAARWGWRQISWIADIPASASEFAQMMGHRGNPVVVTYAALGLFHEGMRLHLRWRRLGAPWERK